MKTRIVRGRGAFSRLPQLVAELGLKRPLLVTDPGLLAAGHPERALAMLEGAGLFAQVSENPTSEVVEACCLVARELGSDGFIGLGGGSSLDTARMANFLFTHGGRVEDYRGSGKARHAMKPLVCVPTTAGTGSEMQSYALISDPITHQKMACGDPRAAASLALLDPVLTLTQPHRVTACTGIDALAHSLECLVTRTRNPLSLLFARQAFARFRHALPGVLDDPSDLAARAAMQWGAALAGLAIEHSMLGAAHAAANPLTARYDTSHGHAVGLMLPHVIRWNSRWKGPRRAYARLMPNLAGWVEQRLAQAGLSPRPAGFRSEDIPLLAAQAAAQWTAAHNPVPVDYIQLYGQL